MLTFTLSGRVECIRSYGDATLRLTILSSRVESEPLAPEDEPTIILSWFDCLCRGEELCAKFKQAVARGDVVKLEGFIEIDPDSPHSELHLIATAFSLEPEPTDAVLPFTRMGGERP